MERIAAQSHRMHAISNARTIVISLSQVDPSVPRVLVLLLVEFRLCIELALN